MTPQPTTTPHEAAGGPGLAVLSLLSWLLATALVALSPLVYFAAGGSESASEVDRVAVAAVLLVLGWPLLALSMGLARRRPRATPQAAAGPAVWTALVLVLSAGAMLALARQLGAAAAIHGDTTWGIYWAGCAGVWIMLSRRVARHPAGTPIGHGPT
jgi:hypothetical protein